MLTGIILGGLFTFAAMCLLLAYSRSTSPIEVFWTGIKFNAGCKILWCEYKTRTRLRATVKGETEQLHAICAGAGWTISEAPTKNKDIKVVEVWK